MAIKNRINTTESKINVVEEKLKALPESKERIKSKEDCRCIVERYKLRILSVDKWERNKSYQMGKKKKKPNIRISLCVFCADLKVLHCSDKISERPHLDMFWQFFKKILRILSNVLPKYLLNYHEPKFRLPSLLYQ